MQIIQPSDEYTPEKTAVIKETPADIKIYELTL